MKIAMKNYLYSAFALFAITFANAQQITTTDAIRYSQQDFNGTARYRAMGGAFGALGGDFSAINVNPAGSAIFTTNQFSATIANLNTKTDSNYFGSSGSESRNNFDFSQAGAVFVFNNDDEGSNWRKLTLAVNYENQLLNNRLFATGTNPNNSLSTYFTNFANMDGGIALNTLNNSSYEQLDFASQQALLGYEGFLINPTGNGAPYVSNVATGSYFQQNEVESSGYNGKVSFNLATQYQDRFYFGLNLNSHFTDYSQISSIYESNTNDATSGVQRARFSNQLYTYGSGFSFGLGAIAKVTKEVRFGLAYESPTWMQLNDELSQKIGTVYIENGAETQVNFNPQITNVYETYRLQTPGKWTGSFAYVFGKKGLISVDYALKDYSNTKFKPNRDFDGLNNEMSETLDVAGELRIGGEYRYKDFSFRAGFRNDASPYKNSNIMGDLTGYSGGLGYNFGSTKLDLAYSYSQRDFQQGFLSSGLTNPAQYKSVNNNVSLTLIFEM